MITVEVSTKDAAQFNNAVNNIIATSKRDLREVINQQAKLLANQFMVMTPPFANGKIPGGEDSKTKTKADQIQGMNAVRESILKTMTPPSILFPNGFKDKNLEKIVKRKDLNKIQAYFDNVKSEKLKGWKVKPFNQSLHTNVRTYGNRFRPKPQKVFVDDERAVQKYIREKQRLVGYMAAGWAVAVTKWGGKVASWISRLIPISKGTATVLVDNGTNYVVEMSNSAASASRFTRLYNVAVRMRTNALLRMYSDYLDKNLKGNLK